MLNLILLVAAVELVAMLHVQLAPLPPKIPRRLTMQTPPGNFGAVEPGRIYRSQYPQPENFVFLAGLGLKTVL